MNSPRRLTSLALALGLATASTALAGLMPLPEATFGGSGIPNDRVAVATYSGPDFAITLGLTATPRYNNPALTDDGVDTFFALAGDDGARVGTDPQPGYALWNLGFYGSFEASLPFYSGDGTVSLFYDLDPTAANSGHVAFTAPLGALAGGVQDSWNLGMSFLSGGLFNPNAAGEYNFRLVAQDGTNVLAESAITVVVTAVPDNGYTLVLIGLALIAIALFVRRQHA